MINLIKLHNYIDGHDYWINPNHICYMWLSTSVDFTNNSSIECTSLVIGDKQFKIKETPEDINKLCFNLKAESIINGT